MNCSNCGSKMEKGWNFCPKCGFHIARQSFLDKILLKAVTKMGPFKDMNKVFEEMEKKGVGRKQGAFSISIRFGENNVPQVKIQPMGVPASPAGQKQEQKNERVPDFTRKISGEIREPKTKLRRVNNKFIADILLPDIDSDKDIEIRKIGESIEVRAYAKDKTYFKILKCPPAANIINQNFDRGKLLLEYA